MDLSRMSDVEGSVDSSAIMDSTGGGGIPESSDVTRMRSPLSKTRSLSDGGGTPNLVSKLSPSPFIIQGPRRESKDDITIRDKESSSSTTTTTTTNNSNNNNNISSVPSTPIRTGFHMRGLSLQMPSHSQSQSQSQYQQQQHQSQQQQSQSQSQSQQSAGYVRQAPLSPKLDHSHIYASPTNILPRRSRGLDFSRAATSLHHSTLADPAEPDSSPTIGSRAMNIPGRRNASDYPSAADHHIHNPSSLWGVMGNQERMQVSSSLGSTNHVLSDSSSASDEDDLMDEDMDEAYITTPQAPGRMGAPGSSTTGMNAPPWMAGSPAVNSLLSFQQRQRQRKQPKKKMRGPLGLGFHSPAAAPGAIAKSPPSSLPHSRRESISWAANQLHISGNESDSGGQVEGLDSPSRPSIVRRAVTRRGNLLPKTKGFARIRAALLEESAPLETEIRSEAEVVRQVRESDMDLEPRLPPPAHSVASTALSSPNLDSQPLDSLSEDAMMIEPAPANSFLSLKQQALKNSKGGGGGKNLWDGFPETGRTTPPPPSFYHTRGSIDDVNMDSPSASSQSQSNSNINNNNNPFVVPLTTSSSSGNGTPQPPPLGTSPGCIPTAADITRRINSKRRRGDDEFDPISIKRRAVSPGMSAHNSPIMQSPLQRDSNTMPPWASQGGGTSSTSRPGSVSGGDSRSENGSGSGNGGGSGRAPGGPGKVRVGYQGMVDTNDGITKLSIE